MVAAAHVVGNMVKLAGANLGESFFNKEVGQAIQMIDGAWRLDAAADIQTRGRKWAASALSSSFISLRSMRLDSSIPSSRGFWRRFGFRFAIVE